MYARTMADVGVAAHAHRNYRANGEARPGMFTRGNRTWLGERDDRPEMLANLDQRFAGLGLSDRVPVFAARRPYADLPDPKPQGTVALGRFKVKSVEPKVIKSDSCEGCFMVICECGKW